MRQTISLRIKIELTGLSDLEPPSYELEDTIVVPEGARLLIMMADETIVTLFSAERSKSELCRHTARNWDEYHFIIRDRG